MIAGCERYHIKLAVQTAFIDWPQEPDSYLEQILGERAGRLNPIRTFCEHGLILSAGSDGPCTDPDPLLWMYKACNHSNPAESISVQQALRMCTYNGYYTTFDERERGSLEALSLIHIYCLLNVTKLSQNTPLHSKLSCRFV